MNKIFQNYSSLDAFGAGISALGYAYFFVVARDPALSAFFLTLMGLFGVKVVVALYERLKDTHGGFALLGLVFGAVGTLGTMVHGGYDLANVINPSAGVAASLPSQIDPRGLLAFGATGLAILYFSWLMMKGRVFPKSLAYLGFVSGVLLIWIYVARLTILNPADPRLLYPVLLEGFIVNPLWYIWLGVAFKK